MLFCVVKLFGKNNSISSSRYKKDGTRFLCFSSQNVSYYRIVGYLVIILMHSINTSVMLYGFRGDVFKDPNIQVFYYFMDKFITCWTFTFQTLHAVLGLACEVLTLMTEGQKEHKLLQFMKYVRNAMFVSIVVPYTFTIGTIFWPIFLYNRELILPAFTTKIVGSISNHVMHSAIIPASLWTMYFHPQHRPASHKEYVAITSLYTLVYLTVMFVTYFKKGLFPYPLLDMLFGSAYFPVLLVAITVWLFLMYYAQWSIYSVVHRWQNYKVEKVC